MFNIVQVRITGEQLQTAIDRSAYPLENLRKADLMLHNGVWSSRPMSTTSAFYFALEQELRSAFGDPSHLIADLTADYSLLRTRAPKAYDYDYVIEVGRVDGEFGEERLVAMPTERVAYQSGRYSSGLFTPIDCTLRR